MPHSNTNLARRVVCNAHQYNRIPSVVTDSWAQLKEAAGHPISPDRMERLQSQKLVALSARRTNTPTPPPINPVIADHIERAPRITARVAARLAQLRGAA